MSNIAELEKDILTKLNASGECPPEKWEDSLSFWYQFGINEMFSIAREIDSFKRDLNISP